MENGRVFIIQVTQANLQVYADRLGLPLGSIEDWKRPENVSKAD